MSRAHTVSVTLCHRILEPHNKQVVLPMYSYPYVNAHLEAAGFSNYAPPAVHSHILTQPSLTEEEKRPYHTCMAASQA